MYYKPAKIAVLILVLVEDGLGGPQEQAEREWESLS